MLVPIVVMRSGIYWIKSTNTQYSTSLGCTSKAEGMSESTPILLGFAILFSVVTLLAKGLEVRSTFVACDKENDLAFQYMIASIVAACALPVVVGLTFHLDVQTPTFEYLLMIYLGSVVFETFMASVLGTRWFVLKSLVVVTFGLLFWTIEVTDERLLKIAASPLLLYHTLFDLFLVDLVRSTNTCDDQRSIVA